MISNNIATQKSTNNYKELFHSLLIAVIIALFIRSVLFEPFSVPTGSMKPNILEGDYLFVSKYYYGISRYSFPFGINLFKGRKFVLHKPQRGDVIVFRLPAKPSIYYIKRLVGLPGDKVQIKDGALYINDIKIPTEPSGTFKDKNDKILNMYLEKLPSGVSYNIMDETPYGMHDNTPIYEVPEGKYFFMGDNRDNSADSRSILLGFVPEEFIIGKAQFILFSNEEPIWKLWKWVFSFNTSRFFTNINP